MVSLDRKVFFNKVAAFLLAAMSHGNNYLSSDRVRRKLDISLFGGLTVRGVPALEYPESAT